MAELASLEAVDDDFAVPAAKYRRELLAFCYRMLGSPTDAEDVVQEVYLSAWRAYGSFEGRSSLRTWLYRIATRACLKALDGAARLPLPAAIGAPGSDPEEPLEARLPERAWLQPFPTDPAAAAEASDTLRLALVAAFQYLPPRQRAVLILRDVLQWRAAEVADLLDMTTTAVNSALLRARARFPVAPEEATEPVELAEPARRALLDGYAAAFEAADVGRLVALLTEDASWEMPPVPTWFLGRDAIVAFLGVRMRRLGAMRVVPVAANGQPAFALYARHRDGSYRPHGIHVLTVTGDGITQVVAFNDPRLFPLFGLPQELDQ